MTKEQSSDLLTWVQHNYQTLYYRKGYKIKELIKSMSDMKVKDAKIELQKKLIQLNNGLCSNTSSNSSASGANAAER